MDTPQTRRLLRDHWHLCRLTARKRYPALPECDIDDLEAVGLAGLLRAARSWRPGGGRLFSSYAILCISRALQNERLTEKRRRDRETEGMATVSLSEPILNDGAALEDFLPDPHTDIEGQFIGREEFEDRLLRVWHRAKDLPPRQREALHLHFRDDRPLGEVGRVMGVSEKAGRQAVYHAVESLRQFFR